MDYFSIIIELITVYDMISIQTLYYYRYQFLITLLEYFHHILAIYKKKDLVIYENDIIRNTNNRNRNGDKNFG